MGVVLAAELPEQLVGPLEVAVGGLNVVPAVQLGDGVGGDTAQGSPDRRGDRPVVVVLLHPGGGGFERRARSLAVDDPAGDGQGEGVGPGTALDEPQDGVGGVPEAGHQAMAQAVPQLRRGGQVAGRAGPRDRPEQQRHQVRLALAHVEDVAAEGTPDRPAVEDARRDGRVAVGRGVLDQGLGDGRVADGAVEFLRPEQGAEGGPVVDGEEAAAGQPGDDIVPEVGLLQAGQQDDPALRLLGVPQRLPDPEDRVGPDDSGLAEVEFHLVRPGPGGGDVQADGEGVLVPLPLVLDDRPQLLRAEGTDAHCGSSSIVHSTVSR